jgi:diaminopimelate decarboxylase
MNLEKLKFLQEEQALKIASEFGTPIFVYSEKEIEARCNEVLAFPNEYGLSVRFAMKANPNSTLLKIMKKKGIHIDASSIYEVQRALHVGFEPAQIMLTAQELASDFADYIKLGVLFNACSLYQLEEYGKKFQNSEVSIRINPGLGSGATKKTDVGGTNSAFGIWHESIAKIQEIQKKYNLKITKVHTHIGSGSDPEVWKAVSHYTLQYAEIFSEATTVSLGGGYKVGRMQDEKTTDLQAIGLPVKELFIEFYKKHNRKLILEIEPGTYLIALCGSTITRVMDKIDTGKNGFEFIKLDTGMDSNTRPSLYASRHPLIVIQKGKKSNTIKDYIVAGHCCESGDIFTQQMGGDIETRSMSEASIDDLVIMEGTGAYCSGMSTKNYNSYPEIAEVLIRNNGTPVLIRKKQELKQIFQNEVLIDI